jgi:hypothetical protein
LKTTVIRFLQHAAIVLPALMMSGVFTLHAQNIEQVLKAKPVTVTGGLNASGTGYTASGSARRDPFSYQLGANLNFNFFGVIDAPFSFYMTSENKTFNRPSYRQFGASPSYRWITVHAGWRNMEFSPYTLSGATFLGGGVELQPETFPLRGKIVYGRFAKRAVLGDTISSYITEPLYNRWGYGAMLSAGPLKNSVDLIIFRAEDRYDDNLLFVDSIPVTPQENLVLGISTRQQITRYFNLTVQYAVSAYTSDTRAAKRDFSSYTYLNNFGPLYTPRYSSTHSSVLDAQLNFQTDLFSAGVSYRRIEPGFQSMGTLFLNNDAEDIQVNASTTLLNRKISLSGSIGSQRDNLDRRQSTDNRRMTGNFNGSWQIMQNLNVTANYSNFNSTTEPTRVLIEDSIKYAQVSRNLGAGVNYSTSGEVWGHLYNLTYARQTVNTINTEFTAIERSGTQMNNVTAGYRISHKPTDIGVSASFNFSQYKMDSLVNVNFGPQISTSKSFLNKKLRTSLSWSLQCSDSDNSRGAVNVWRFTAGYSAGKHHSFSFNSNLMRRRSQPSGKERTSSSELMGTLAYNYSF